MNGHDLKRALMRRHEITQHPTNADAAALALKSICEWLDWDLEETQQRLRRSAASR